MKKRVIVIAAFACATVIIGAAAILWNNGRIENQFPTWESMDAYEFETNAGVEMTLVEVEDRKLTPDDTSKSLRIELNNKTEIPQPYASRGTIVAYLHTKEFSIPNDVFSKEGTYRFYLKFIGFCEFTVA